MADLDILIMIHMDEKYTRMSPSIQFVIKK